MKQQLKQENGISINQHTLSISVMTKIALCTALLCVSGYIFFPLPFTPVVLSAQTLVICLQALILRPKYAVLVQLLYIFLGAVGLPVFSGGSSGLSKLFGPTGGYYFGFIFAAFFISLLKGHSIHLLRYILVTIIFDLIFSLGFGAVFMAIYNRGGLLSVMITAVFPFIPGDIAKCIMASLIAVALNKALRKANLNDDVC